MDNFTLSMQTVQNQHKWIRIPSSFELIFKSVFITTLLVFFLLFSAIWTSLVVFGLSTRI